MWFRHVNEDVEWIPLCWGELPIHELGLALVTARYHLVCVSSKETAVVGLVVLVGKVDWVVLAVQWWHSSLHWVTLQQHLTSHWLAKWIRQAVSLWLTD